MGSCSISSDFFPFLKKKFDKLLLFYLDTDMAFFIVILVAMSASSVPTKYTVCHVGSFHEWVNGMDQIDYKLKIIWTKLTVVKM